MIHWLTDPEFMTDAELLEEYDASKAEAGDQRDVALAQEIQRRGLHT